MNEERICERAIHPDEPSKAFLLKLDPDCTLPHFDRLSGAVYWDARPPAGVSFTEHRYTFLHAFITALTFLETESGDEWIILGQIATDVVRALTQFIPVQTYNECSSCSLLGRIGRLRVYSSSLLAVDAWFVVRGGCSVKGLILNAP